MSSFNLSTDSIKIKISVGQPTPKRKLPTISKETAERHGVDVASIDTHITVLRKEDVFKVQKLITAARDYLKDQTSPWTDDGWRLLMLSQRNKVKGKLNEYRDEFNTLTKEAVLDRYDEILANARIRLNGLFSLVKFPSREEMMDDYRWELWEEPIGSADNAPAQLVDSTKKYYESKIEQAQNHVLTKMEDVVRRVCALSIDGKKRFHDTIIENIKDELEVLPVLNITGDDKIAAIIARLKNDLASIKPDDLRKSKEERIQAVKSAREILTSILDAKGQDATKDDLLQEVAMTLEEPEEPADEAAEAPVAVVAEPVDKGVGYENKTMCAMLGIDPPRPITRWDVDNAYPGMPTVADAMWKQIKDSATKQAPKVEPVPLSVQATDTDILDDIAQLVG